MTYSVKISYRLTSFEYKICRHSFHKLKHILFNHLSCSSGVFHIIIVYNIFYRFKNKQKILYNLLSKK